MAGLSHHAVLYAGEPDFAGAVAAPVGEALAAGMPVFAALPSERLDLLHSLLGVREHPSLQPFDMRADGRNPARSMLQASAFFSQHPARQGLFVGEPLYPGRTREEAAEVAINEALVDVAFADAPLTVLCPYDTVGLGGDDALASAAATHGTVLRNGAPACACHGTPAERLAAALEPLPAPCELAVVLPVDMNLQLLRRRVRDFAGHRLAPQPLQLFQLAVCEAATNALRHGAPPATVSLWHESASVVCEVADAGRCDDPGLGRRRPDPGTDGGHGLWLVQHACDLVQIRSDGSGTRVRLRIRALPPAAPADVQA